MRSFKPLFLGLIFVLGACAAETGEVGGSSAELSRICPAIMILCAPGYQVKQLPNCDQICVPADAGGPQRECNSDRDCGPIYCITSPCEQPVCRGHQCVLPPSTPGPSPGAGEPCGDVTCGAQSYCCNASCGICAPLDGACIQIACL